MKRLVYNPRAYVFVKDVKGKVHDLSPYVTAGNVVRKIDQVSTAEVTIRNPEMKWTAHRDGDNIVLPTFSPMDPITIYLRRMPGHPVRVFTGFLDQTPYLQLFPGKVTLKASCTLKRLLYTYFDPALPYTQSFLREYGWVEMENGVWGSFAGLDTYKPPDPLAPLPNGIQAQASGSISELLNATLQYIGNWNKNSIYIEKIPDGIFPRLAELATEFQDEQKEAKKAYEDLFKKIVGSTSVGGAITDAGTGGANASSSGTLTRENTRGITVDGAPLTDTMIREINVLLDTAARLSKSTKATLAILCAGYQESRFQPEPGNSSGYGGVLGGSMKVFSPNDTSKMAHYFFVGGNGYQAGGANYLAKHSSYSPGQIAVRVEAPGMQYEHLYIDKEPTARKLLEAYNKGARANSNRDTTSSGSPTSTTNNANNPRTVEGQQKGGKDLARASAASTSRSNRQGGSTKTNASGDVTGMAVGIKGDAVSTSGGGAYWAPRPGQSPPNHKGVDISMPEGTKLTALCDGTIAYTSHSWYSSSNGKGEGVITIKSAYKVGPYPAGTMFGYGHPDIIYKSAGDHVKAGEIIALSGNPGGGPHLHFFVNTAGVPSANGNVNPTSLAQALLNGTQLPTTGGGGPTTAGDASQNSSAPGGDSGGAAALFATLDLPGALDTIGAQMLSGEKSLMNDKPLMPFVQQLCNASLRHFQSMPDGKFFAFYPDYFGEFNQHPPYWEIDDIEIIDGGVDLSDDALVTHSYVVGDTASPTIGASAGFFQRAVFSAGVVTIFNAFLNEDMLTKLDHPDQKKGSKKKDANTQDPPKGLGISLDAAEAQAFLTRYGARPLTEDMPFIKSNFYEMFLAYQKFLLGWSRQFLTPFMFTFMPEVYPGGKVGFPQHDLQMYIEEVNHSWDLESGFTTRAALSAPSVYKTKDGKQALGLLPPNMVKGLIEPVSKSRASDAPDQPMSVPAPQVDPASNPTFAPVPTAPIPGQSTGGLLAPD